MKHLDGSDCPVQPPAPDPDETCAKCRHVSHDSLGFCPNMASDNDCDCSGTAPVPPAVTGPADEAEGLAEVLDSIVAWVEGWVANRVAAPTIIRAEAKMLLNRHADVLTARDAAQQRIGAEKAWDRGYVAGHSVAMRRMSDEPKAPDAANPYRADRIAREGQA